MRHADHELPDARLAAALDQVVQHRDQAVAALEGETLLPDVASVQIALDALGTRQLFEYPPPLVFGQRVRENSLFESLA